MKPANLSVICYLLVEIHAVTKLYKLVCCRRSAHHVVIAMSGLSSPSKTDVPVPSDAVTEGSHVPPTTTAGHQQQVLVGGRHRAACSGCGHPIADRFLLYAMDRHWHVGCLRCSVCHVPLDDAVATCYTRAGLILCRTDYIRFVGLISVTERSPIDVLNPRRQSCNSGTGQLATCKLLKSPIYNPCSIFGETR